MRNYFVTQDRTVENDVFEFATYEQNVLSVGVRKSFA